MDVKIEGKTLVIRLPIEPSDSKTGKSITIASTRGNQKTDVEYEGKKIVLGVNAYIPIK